MKPIAQPGREFRIVAAGLFKATCLQLMDEVYANRNLTIIVTKRGKPVMQMSAPPEGLTLSGPTVELEPDTYVAAQVTALQAEATATFEQGRKKKKDKKKKHK
ncbi:hypothetical protein GOB94_08910 [Granulicella sp. 5B5]|uniref:hypothetical protein n=1 Tax=Granulicella sp. 5B5 TaxID=1617967 RepID=UPI0015F6B885|nr:hypothetical protein [Granulicella sp. 5B5]QMV18788.1 hypothetical protein GOB94_08910 [Granulicella sp. 5B5]